MNHRFLILNRSRKLPLLISLDISGFFTNKNKPTEIAALTKPSASIVERQPNKSAVKASGAAPARFPNEPTPIIIAARLANIFGSYIRAKI